MNKVIISVSFFAVLLLTGCGSENNVVGPLSEYDETYTTSTDEMGVKIDHYEYGAFHSHWVYQTPWIALKNPAYLSEWAIKKGTQVVYKTIGKGVGKFFKGLFGGIVGKGNVKINEGVKPRRATTQPHQIRLSFEAILIKKPVWHDILSTSLEDLETLNATLTSKGSGYILAQDIYFDCQGTLYALEPISGTYTYDETEREDLEQYTIIKEETRKFRVPKASIVPCIEDEEPKVVVNDLHRLFPEKTLDQIAYIYDKYLLKD